MTETAENTVDRLAWVDVETTGLVAHREHLLEVAILVTDTNLRLLDEGGYQTAIFHGPERVAEMREAADPFVRDMHDRTGLWERCADPKRSTPLADVDRQVLVYLSLFAPGHRQARLAGNSVRLDLNFLEEHLPSMYDHLHYRSMDMTALSSAALWWLGIEPPTKVMAHTAMGDIRESLAEARALRDALIEGVTK